MCHRDSKMKLATTLSIGITAISVLGTILVRASTDTSDGQSRNDVNWSELLASMKKMHMAMEAIKPSGDSDVDFVRLMLPHHQAAIDMAKTQLLYGKDPQMRRLAQEIITDQQLEIDLMQRWLKKQKSAAAKENQPTPPDTGKNHEK
jgi:Domain of unknown function (DUF305)